MILQKLKKRILYKCRLQLKEKKKERKITALNMFYSCRGIHFKVDWPFKNKCFQFGKLRHRQSHCKSNQRKKCMTEKVVLTTENLNVAQNRTFMKVNE